MAVSFTRQLGAESGVQLNPLRDNSELPIVGDNSDQCFGIAMRATRGRIDKPFKVHKGNVLRSLGFGEQVRTTALNEAWVHVVEAVNSGTYEAVVQRLVSDAAVIKYAVVKIDPTTGVVTFETATTEPTTGFLLSVKHLGCFNDGIHIAVHSDENKVGGVAQPNSKVTLRILDPRDKVPLYEFSGSLTMGSKDDSGNSNYLPDVVAALTDMVEVVVGDAGSIPVASPMYGYNASTGKEKWVESPVMVVFSEGSMAYTTTDYQRAREKLQYTPHNYAYIASGGTRAVGLIAQLAQLAFDTNRQFKLDVPGEYGVDAAIAFVEQLNLGASPTAHLMHYFWAPIKTDDPTGVNPKGYFGTATLNIAMCNARNAQTNARGFAPKNYPVAGREFPVRRTRATQMVELRDQDLNALAKAKINPVVYENFTGGGRYVFRDSLTAALTETSLKKLISVADMSSSIDDAVTRFSKDIAQAPMKIAVKRTSDFLTSLFEGAEASGWLVPSQDKEMGGKAWKFDVRPNAARPADRLDVNYWLRYDGVARQIFVTQTLVI